MTAPSPEVLADPLGVIVDLVGAVETTLDRDSIAEVVTGVAGGRAKRRRLAHALQQRPAVLTDGRSPVPRALGDLLIALRNAGVISIAAPVCAECDKPLRSLQRRGQHWYCGGCGAQAGAVHWLRAPQTGQCPRPPRTPALRLLSAR